MPRIPDPPSDIRDVIAAKLARSILAGFESMFAEFLNITLTAQARFERAAWHEVQDAMRQRLKVYEAKIAVVSDTARLIAYDELDNADIWYQAKKAYACLVEEHQNSQIAQTFFNSVFGAIRGHRKIRDVHLFILDQQYMSDQQSRYSDVVCELDSSTGLVNAIRQLLGHFKFRLPYQDLEQDIQSIHRVLKKIDASMLSIENCHIEFGGSLFFRNKAAYIVGRLIDDDQQRNIPFSLAILNNEQGQLYVDAIILGAEQLGLLFGYARSYFMVDTDQPAYYVDYLCNLMPQKERFELFNAIGFIKHAKTEFYRFKVNSTRNMPATEKYIAAPGIKGMVMLVFTTEHSDYVYKVIKDKFTPPKTSNRQQVMDKYNFVKNADRVGRLVDTHEFRYLAFDLSRFSPSLLEEIQQQACDSVIISGNALILKHVYVERKMPPLNLYVKEADDDTLSQVMDDYGHAIKQLAAANIFPGDMLMKNFGVTRWNKVVFYDYDEICPLTECNFKSIPVPNDVLDEMSDQPWFDVDQDDVFPEQFAVFFAGHPSARRFFNQYHQDIYQPHFWQKTQQAINQGKVADVFPYRVEWRFPGHQTITKD